MQRAALRAGTNPDDPRLLPSPGSGMPVLLSGRRGAQRYHPCGTGSFFARVLAQTYPAGRWEHRYYDRDRPRIKDLSPMADAAGSEQARFLDCLDAKYVDLAIVSSAALSLFLELGMIRWQSTVLEFFAFYKNLSLLGCVAGLGLGYALAQRDRIPVLLVLPLLAWQFGLLIFVRFGMAAGNVL
ncbi:MAG: hypothetical protein ABSG25_06220, partial [Bryobacteraceae bacterium]